MATENDFVVMRRFLLLLLRRWWLLALAIALAVGFAYVLTRRQTPVYQATTSLIVGQTIQSVDLTARDIQISAQVALVYADLARRQPVLQAALNTLGLDMTWRELKSLVTVNVSEEVYLLEITAEGASLEEAQAIANEVARQLILLSPRALESREPDANERFVQQRLTTLRTRIQEGQVELEALEAAVVGADSATQVNFLREEIHLLEGFLTDWESNYAQLLALSNPEQSANYLAVIEPAQGVPFPVRPNLYLNALIASLVGIGVAVGLVVLRDYLDDTLKTAEDTAQSLNLSPLGSVAHMRGRRYAHRLISRYDPFSPASESYRIIRSNLDFLPGEGTHHTLLVTSATRGEGKSTVSSNLAIAMAQAGHRTIIVDADLRQPTQHIIFERPNRSGLTDLLSAPKATAEACLLETAIPNLRLLTSGGLPLNPSELLSSPRMLAVMTSLKDLADVVIFDGTPVLNVADAVVLAKQVNGVLLVVKAGRTQRSLIRQAVANLTRVGATVLGVVLNRTALQKSYYRPARHGSVLARTVMSTWQRFRRWSGV